MAGAPSVIDALRGEKGKLLVYCLGKPQRERHRPSWFSFSETAPGKLAQRSVGASNLFRKQKNKPIVRGKPNQGKHGSLQPPNVLITRRVVL